MAKINHLARLPVGTAIQITRELCSVENQEYPEERWIGRLEAPWQDHIVEVTHTSTGLMGTISALAKKWSKQCPNATMRRDARINEEHRDCI